MPDIYLPNIIKLELTNFSLYCEQSVVMDFSKPVSCLMGANGIGKSTLLNCVNFAITGRINPTNKKLKSIDTLDRGNNYYLQYFDGRISEVDKDYASTRIVFMLGNKRIEVVRNFFPDNSILEYKLDNETQDPRNYEDDVVRLANLNNYAQFVFLQLKVLTFDESRDCLFWNPSILTPTIFLCLGESVDNAERADELAREIQKVNSRIRNVQWEISKQSARLTTLIEEKSKTEEARPHYASEDEASAQNEYEEIIKELEEGESYHQGYTKERQQIYARITELTVEKVRLRKEYEEHYAELYAGNGHLYRNPIIMALTSDGCPICHTAHQKLPEHIEQALNQNVCPLCGEHIPETASEQTEIIAKLAKIDNNLSKIEHELEELILRQQTVEEQLDNLKKKIEEFFRFITSIFERTPPELITWKFKVIMPVGDWDFSQKIILNFHRMNEVFTSECAFIIVDSNLYLIEPYEADYSGRDHICYQYNAPQNESLTIKDKQFQLSEYYDSAITSIFAQPTYKELDEAMDYYNTRYVRDSSCAVLSQIWTDEAKREFVQKPEHFMRDSLWQCLQNILRNHTVKREQIVDATHPVDIKVTWPAINNVALIEVKWLGDSGQTQYRDARANEGAKQLIDYLASSVQEEPDKHFVGYLTVFDGRRGKTSNQYERQEINYRSEYSSHPSMNYRRFYMAECV